MCVCVCVVSREPTPVLRGRYDSCAGSSCLSSTASSTHSVHGGHAGASPQLRRHRAGPFPTVGRYHPSSSVSTSPYEYDIGTATSSESMARSAQSSAARHIEMRSLAGSVASEGREASSCRFGDRGGVTRFLAAARHRESSQSVDSGYTADYQYHTAGAGPAADFKRASEPQLHSCGMADAPLAGRQRCPSSASAPGTADLCRGHRVGGSVASKASSLMSSRTSIATNMSDDVDVKFSPPAAGCGPAAAADNVSDEFIIPDEMLDFINSKYGGQPASGTTVPVQRDTAAVTADSTVADSPAAAAPVVDSTSALDESPAGNPSKPTTLVSSCMYEAQPGGNSTTQPVGNSTQLQQSGTPAVGDMHSASHTPARPFDVPATPRSTSSYFRSPIVAPTYQNDDEVQVSQVSQSWRPDGSGPRNSYSCRYRTSGGTALELSADDMAVRHRRNPHQMNWWTRAYGYHVGGSVMAHSYQPNYNLPAASVHPPRTGASFLPSSQTSPTCNQVLLNNHLCSITFYSGEGYAVQCVCLLFMCVCVCVCVHVVTQKIVHGCG